MQGSPSRTNDVKPSLPQLEQNAKSQNQSLKVAALVVTRAAKRAQHGTELGDTRRPSNPYTETLSRTNPH